MTRAESIGFCMPSEALQPPYVNAVLFDIEYDGRPHTVGLHGSALDAMFERAVMLNGYDTEHVPSLEDRIGGIIKQSPEHDLILLSMSPRVHALGGRAVRPYAQMRYVVGDIVGHHMERGLLQVSKARCDSPWDLDSYTSLPPLPKLSDTSR